MYRHGANQNPRQPNPIRLPPSSNFSAVSLPSPTNGSTASPKVTPDPAKQPAAKKGDTPIKNNKRINWGKGEHRDLLEKAIDGWLNKTGKVIYDDNDEEIADWRVFVNKLGIRQSTYYKYINPNESKYRKLRDGARGKKSILSCDNVTFLGNVLTCADRGNAGMSTTKAIDMITELKVKLVWCSTKHSHCHSSCCNFDHRYLSGYVVLIFFKKLSSNWSESNLNTL